jgi:hypothetical protein
LNPGTDLALRHCAIIVKECQYGCYILLAAIGPLCVLGRLRASRGGRGNLHAEGRARKILRSKDVNDVDSYVGLAWSLTNVRRDGNFLSGTLVTPRQSTDKWRVFAIADEWDCG